MSTAHIARNGIITLGVFLSGAAWGEFFPVAALALIATGVAVALGSVYAAAAISRI